MTASAGDVAQGSAGTANSVPNMIARLMLAVIGSAFVCSAFGLWLIPGDGVFPEMSLIKMGLSLFMLIGGMCCLVCAKSGGGRTRQFG